jgi:hypothetical protein
MAQLQTLGARDCWTYPKFGSVAAQFGQLICALAAHQLAFSTDDDVHMRESREQLCSASAADAQLAHARVRAGKRHREAALAHLCVSGGGAKVRGEVEHPVHTLLLMNWSRFSSVSISLAESGAAAADGPATCVR